VIMYQIVRLLDWLFCVRRVAVFLHLGTICNSVIFIGSHAAGVGVTLRTKCALERKALMVIRVS
jgi:hypothetical protein